MAERRQGTYIHYWYQDYVDKHNNNLNSMFGSSKSVGDILSSTLTKHLNAFQNQRLAAAFAGSENVQAAQRLYADMSEKGQIGQKIESSIQEIMSSGGTSLTGARKTGFTVGGQDQSYLQISGKYSKEGAAEAELKALVDGFGTVLEDANRVLSEIVDIMEQSYDDLEVMSILSHMTDGINSMADEEIYRRAIGQVPKNQLLSYGDVQLSSTQKSILDSYQRIYTRIQALRQFEPGGARSGMSTVTKGHEIAALIGKIGGSISNAGGILNEVAVSYGFQKGASEALDEIDMRIKTAVSGQRAKYTGDPEMEMAGRQARKTAAFNKGDVTVSIAGDGIVMNYAVTAKKTSAPSSGRNWKTNIKLNQESNLMQMLQRAQSNQSLSVLGGSGGSFMNFVYNTASGKTTSKKGGTNRKYKGRGESAVSNVWRSIVDYVVYANFLDSLAGDLSSSSNNVIFMVVNNRIYTIAEILEQVIYNPSSINYTGGKNRSQYHNLNVWFSWNGSDDLNEISALARSMAAEQSLTQAFQSTKITTKLNMAMLKF